MIPLPNKTPTEDCGVPTCEYCKATENLIAYPVQDGRWTEYVCPAHSQARALNKAAHEHLMVLMDATMREWVEHWSQTAIGVADLADALDWYFERRGRPEIRQQQEYVRGIIAQKAEATD